MPGCVSGEASRLHGESLRAGRSQALQFREQLRVDPGEIEARFSLHPLAEGGRDAFEHFRKGVQRHQVKVHVGLPFAAALGAAHKEPESSAAGRTRPRNRPAAGLLVSTIRNYWTIHLYGFDQTLYSLMGDDEREPEYPDPEYPDPEHPDEQPDPDWEQETPESTYIHWPRDPKIDQAKPELMKWFESKPSGVFYGRQIEVIFEKTYFHWITHKALKELTNEGLVTTEMRVTPGGNNLRLYWSRRNRYPKRAAAFIVNQVELHSDPEMTRAIGYQAESMFAVAAAREGFRVLGPAIRTFQGKTWSETEHDLDWIFERDGVGWGVGIKNTWAYIDRSEMKTKIELCKLLGVSPLFIMRWAPKSYVELIRQAGGFGLLYETQFFPLGHSAEMAALKELALPVSSPAAVPEATFKRFVKWHEGRLKK